MASHSTAPRLSTPRRLAIIVALCCAALVVDAMPAMVVPASAADGGPFIGLWSDGTAAEAATMDDLGVSWGRVTVRWSAVELMSGTYSWASLDQAFANVSNNGRRQTFATIRNNPAWAAASRCTITTDAERAALARFVGKLVQRYSGTIPDGPLAGRLVLAKYWQLYNEMDFSSPSIEATSDLGGCFATASGATPTQTGRDNYARMLEAVGLTAHTTDPNSKIVMGGVASSNYLSPLCPVALCPFDPGFIPGVLGSLRGRGTLDRLDAVGVHYFSAQAPLWARPGAPDLVGRVIATRQMMRDAGLTTAELKGIFVDEGTFTEGAPASTSDPNDPYNRNQEAYVSKALARAAYANVAGYFWFRRQDTLGPGLGGDWPFGLLDSRGTPKPSYGAYRYFASLVSRTDQVVGQLTFGNPKLEGYELIAKDQRRFQVVWNQADTENIGYSPNFGLGGQITNPVGAAIGPASNHAVSVGAEPRFVFAPICTPRPPIRVTVSPTSGDRLQVTISASTSAGLPNNRLSRLQVGDGSNSLIDISDGPTNVTGNIDLSLASIPSVAFSLRRQNPSVGNATVPLVVTDDCGAWQTFVGGGPAAWPASQAAGPSTSPMPTPTPTPVPVACSPRPAVDVTSTPDGPGRLRVTVSATGDDNRLRELRFGSTANALLDTGVSSGASGPLTVPLPADTRQTSFVLRRATANQPATAQLVAIDACGEWPTFVGGGPSAF
jgi:hypothetical protein